MAFDSTPRPYRAGQQLRQALGLPEPDFASMRGPAPGYFGGFRNAEDERDFSERERRIAEREALEGGE